MYKIELIKRVATETRLTQRVVADVIEASQRQIEQALRGGGRVTLPGFGTFYTSRRKEGKVRHIRSGQFVPVPARQIAAFRVGEVLKRAVRGLRRDGVDRSESQPKKRSRTRQRMAE